MVINVSGGIQIVSFPDLHAENQELVIAASGATAEAENEFMGRWSVGGALRVNRHGEIYIVTRANKEHATHQLNRDTEIRLIEALPDEDKPFAETMVIVGSRPRMGNRILTSCDVCRPVVRDFGRATQKGGDGFTIIFAPMNFRRGRAMVLTPNEIRNLPDFHPDGIDWRGLKLD